MSNEDWGALGAKERRRHARTHGGFIPEASITILPTRFRHAYLLGTTTHDEHRIFNAVEYVPSDPQSSVQFWEYVAWRENTQRKTTVFFSWGVLPEENRAVGREEADFEEPDPRDLLRELQTTNVASRRVRLIIAAESVSFADDTTPLVLSLLRGFIEQHRESNSPEMLIGVESAIRKFVGLLPANRLEEVGFILQPTQRVAVSPTIELEVAKMTVRKLIANPQRNAGTLDLLGEQLMDLARTYLNPRLLPRQPHGAIALNSVLALALMHSHHVDELRQLLERLPVGWFRSLIARRVRETIREVQSRFVNEGEVLTGHLSNCSCLP